MSWRDRLVLASYQGTPFYTTGREAAGSHRHARHEYAGRDGAHFEPLSVGVDRWSVDAFLVGADYLDARDELVETLKNNPVGVYVDPFSGQQRYVAVTGEWSIFEGQSEGLGFCRIGLTFEESIQDPFAPAPMDAIEASKTGGNRYLSWASGLSKSGFVGGLNAALERVEGAAAAVSQLADEVAAIQAAIFGPLAGIVSGAQAAASALADLEGSIQSLASAPGDLYDQAALVFETIGSLDVLSAYTDAHAVTPAETLTGAGAQAASDARLAVSSAFQQAALTAQGSALLAYDWDSADEALAALASWAALVLGQEATMPAAMYAGWVEARARVGQAVEALSLRLPRLMTVALSAPVSTLELAQRYYQDASRADEILARNQAIVHPGFVAGTITLLQPGP